jgi:hypothetical protein
MEKQSFSSSLKAKPGGLGQGEAHDPVPRGAKLLSLTCQGIPQSGGCEPLPLVFKRPPFKSYKKEFIKKIKGSLFIIISVLLAGGISSPLAARDLLPGV